MDIQVKRIYDPVDEDDGFRVLTDRLWPRGMSKDKAALDVWAKDVAPSNELRKWFDHEVDKFEEFKARYLDELNQNPAVPPFLTEINSRKRVTLLYGAKDREHNQAIVLAGYIKKHGASHSEQ
jgi:uncharacterized protein YeaO (DUF488 family)